MSKQLVISNIKLHSDNIEDLLKVVSVEGVHCKEENIVILKKSLDARDKGDIKFVYTLLIKGEYKREKYLSKKCSFKELPSYKLPKSGDAKANGRHVIIGAGPAGLFAGLILARAGYKPLILEQGMDVDRRTEDVEDFWKDGTLKKNSNVCFGEGGAGTFSDGKLNTGVKDDSGRIRYILNEFVKAGANPEIAYWYKPHIGSDVLKVVIKNLREEIIKYGGEIRFNSKLTDITFTPLEIEINESERLRAEDVVLAIGHSARDTYKLLKIKGADMKAKSFAVGVRIEHPQYMINESMYGVSESDVLPAADYRLATNLPSGRGVYTFCMCPGGQVVNSSTDEDAVCINGMSLSKRDGRNANSAIIVTVSPDDFAGDDALSGVEFQKELESNAYKCADGKVPIQLFGDYKKGTISKKLGKIKPDIKGEYDFGNVYEVFPTYISESILQGINEFGKHIDGFDDDDAILSAVESRTSSPVRIVRDEHFESNLKGLFPCGEGAGYAGGIMSAAIDGMKVAEEIISRYKRED